MTAALKSVFTDLLGISEPVLNIEEFSWAHQLTESVKHSPDLGWLEQFDFQLLFCVDDTQSNFPLHPLIQDSARICTAYTQREFNFWEHHVGNDRIPIPMESTGPSVIRYFPPSLKVKGELHAIRPYQFKDLDNYKSNRVQFLRKRMKLIVPYREFKSIKNVSVDGSPLPYTLQGKKTYLSGEKVHLIKAWMYVGHPDYWNDLFDGGYSQFKTVAHHESRRAWLKEYYSYSKRTNEGS